MARNASLVYQLQIAGEDMPYEFTDPGQSRHEIYYRELRRRNLIIEKPFLIKWKVSKFRRDKRTGALSFRPMSKYAVKLYEDAMKKWR